MIFYDTIDRGRGPQLAGTHVTVFDVLHCLELKRRARGEGKRTERC
jgi:hypothetical protein